MEGLFTILQVATIPSRLCLKHSKAVFLRFSALVLLSNVLFYCPVVDSELSNSVSPFYVGKIPSWY